MEPARLDNTVVNRPLKAIINGCEYSDVPSAIATVRTDTNQVLRMVGDRYKPVQNQDAFNFFDPHEDQDEAIYLTVGVLGRGEKIWFLGKLTEYIKVEKKNYMVNRFVQLYNSHDGSFHTPVKLTPIHIICNNTFTTALLR